MLPVSPYFAGRNQPKQAHSQCVRHASSPPHLYVIESGWRHFGDSDTLAVQLNGGEDDGNRYA